MKSHKFSTIVALLLLALLSCNTSNNSSEGKEPEPKKQFKIGAVLPLTGQLSNYGTAVKDGIDLAVNEINEQGGVNGQELVVLCEDSRNQKSRAVAAAKKLVSIEHVPVLIGEVKSTITEDLIRLGDSLGVFVFAPASSSPKLTGQSQLFARNWPSDVAEGSGTAKFTYNELGLTKALVFYVNDHYGIGLHNEFKKAYESLGGTVVHAEQYAPKTLKFDLLIQKTKALEFDCIYLGGHHDEMAYLTKQLREAGIKQQIIADTDFGDPKVIEIAGKHANGAIFGTPSYAPETSDEKQVQDFAHRFQQLYGKKPGLSEANGYDAIMLIAEAVQQHGITGRAIAEHVRNRKNYAGAAGTVSFYDGEVSRLIVFKVIENGVPVIYKK